MPRADKFEANPHWLPAAQGQALDHVPGDDGWPLVGSTITVLADPPGALARAYARYGPVHRHKFLGRRTVMLIGPEANELVLFDRDKVFSSEQGWGPTLNQLFPGGLMLIDFEKHRTHRRMLSVAFKPEPMRRYAQTLNAGIKTRMAAWAGRPIEFYPAIKALTLELAASSFLGIPFGPEAEPVNAAFVAMVQASIAPIRAPIPGTAMGRGVAGRKFLIDFFGKEVPRRRAGDGDDMFSQFCRATDDDGNHLTDVEIVDHLNFLMMAAHDTITSSGTALMMYLGQNPAWQTKLHAEMLGLSITDDDLPYDWLNDLILAEYAFKEALRLMAPVPSIPRRALRAFSYGGYNFPAGTVVGVNPAFVHKMPEQWPDPETFDPMRFSPEGSKGRHKYAWVPFGGGAHMCLGLHFASMQIKILLWHMLRAHTITLPPGSGAKWQAWPIPKPRDGLPLTLSAS